MPATGTSLLNVTGTGDRPFSPPAAFPTVISGAARTVAAPASHNERTIVRATRRSILSAFTRASGLVASFGSGRSGFHFEKTFTVTCSFTGSTTSTLVTAGFIAALSILPVYVTGTPWSGVKTTVMGTLPAKSRA